MTQPCGILVFGANGSGKTTLGRALACMLHVKHMDIEDYHFEASELPYTVERSRDDCRRLMLADIEKHRSFVLSAVTGDFGEEICSRYDLAILLSAPLETRIERIERRAYEAHGARVQKGGDMYERHQMFAAFARTRDLTKIERWAETLRCPLIRVDGTKDYRQTAAEIAAGFKNAPDEERASFLGGHQA